MTTAMLTTLTAAPDRHLEGAAICAAVEEAARLADARPAALRRALRAFGEHAGGCAAFLADRNCATCARLRARAEEVRS